MEDRLRKELHVLGHHGSVTAWPVLLDLAVAISCVALLDRLDLPQAPTLAVLVTGISIALADVVPIEALLVLVGLTTMSYFLVGPAWRWPALDAGQAFRASRGFLLIVTAVCILAVDLPLLPARSMKTETNGFSLMDLGAGAFALMAGTRSELAHADRRSLSAELRRCWPLAALGALRLAAVWITDYQTHTSEYGVHGNFFLVIVVVRLLMCGVGALLPPGQPQRRGVAWLALAAGLTGAWGLLLATRLPSGRSVQDWILQDGRDAGSFLDADREALVAVVGYSVMFAAGAGAVALVRSRPATSRPILAGGAAACIGVALALAGAGLHSPSRRAANPGFLIWCVGASLAIPLVLSRLPRGSRALQLLLRVDHNGAAFFLLANVATGMANLGLRWLGTSTLALGYWESVLVMAGYGVVLSLAWTLNEG